MRVFTSLVVVIVCLLPVLTVGKEVSEIASFQTKSTAKPAKTIKRVHWKGTC